MRGALIIDLSDINNNNLRLKSIIKKIKQAGASSKNILNNIMRNLKDMLFFFCPPFTPLIVSPSSFWILYPY